jgi:hypothetical protein
MNHRSYWVSCERFTVRVSCDGDGVIVEAAPLVRRFVGQHLASLTRWAAGLGGLRVEVL